MLEKSFEEKTTAQLAHTHTNYSILYGPGPVTSNTWSYWQTTVKYNVTFSRSKPQLRTYL